MLQFVRIGDTRLVAEIYREVTQGFFHPFHIPLFIL